MTEHSHYERYAIYYAPHSDSELGCFGNRWLGRNPETGEALKRPSLGRIELTALEALTRSPGRYGFHGTLKPPFRLMEGTSYEQLVEAVRNMCDGLAQFESAPLKLDRIGPFLALVPSEKCDYLSELAQACVETLDHFRAPADENELNRRRQAGLNDIQEENLLRWGYPYVGTEFRFHLTLSDRLDADVLTLLENELSTLVQPVCRDPLVVDHIALFGDPGAGEPFRLLNRFPLNKVD